MLSFYDKIPDMECLQGDTLPSFEITLSEDAPENGSLVLLISKKEDPSRVLVQKTGAATEEGFIVSVTDADTVQLEEGTYLMNFVLIAGGRKYKKLSGFLRVNAAPSPLEV
jgi:hypothetical protein